MPTQQQFRLEPGLRGLASQHQWLCGALRNYLIIRAAVMKPQTIGAVWRPQYKSQQ